ITCPLPGCCGEPADRNRSVLGEANSHHGVAAGGGDAVHGIGTRLDRDRERMRRVVVVAEVEHGPRPEVVTRASTSETCTGVERSFSRPLTSRSVKLRTSSSPACSGGIGAN